MFECKFNLYTILAFTIGTYIVYNLYIYTRMCGACVVYCAYSMYLCIGIIVY